jgi:ubiquinone/menaquinone biosynthesis C-methylase UbiE
VEEKPVTAEEYPNYFAELGGIRARIAADLPLRPGMQVLDLACGYGYFTVEVARRVPDGRVRAIDIQPDNVARARENAERSGLAGRIDATVMDAASMSFRDAKFEMAVSFGGLEDIHMTRGRSGVGRAFHEVKRVLKPGHLYCFAAMPPEAMETEAQKLEVAVYSYACRATWLSADEYRQMLAEAGLELLDDNSYYTGKRLTVEQARQEIRFACDVVPKLYGITTCTFDDVWHKFGPAIEQHGLGQFSKMVVFIARAPG